jgi:Protein of unknown function (DUF3237)
LELTGDGLTLWYGDDLTPAPSGEVPVDLPVSVTVGVRPARPTNAIDVEYRINGGPRRVLHSRLLREDIKDNAQLFRAVFPYLPPGSTVEYAPMLRSMGRRIGSPLGREGLPSFSVLSSALDRQRIEAVRADTVAPHRPIPGLPEPFPFTLERLAHVHCFLAQPEVIGGTPDGLRVNFRILSGRIDGDRLKANVEGGADALRIREDGTGIVGVRTTLVTDDGARIFTEYSGVLDLGEHGYRDAVAGRYPPRPRVHLAPRFLCAAPAYGWLNRLQCMGLGYVTMPTLEVHYDLYAMRLVETGSGTGD